jgi:glycosyltransferase involved in cell wall biosynthesis
MSEVEATTVLFIHGITEIGGAERELLVIVDRLPRCGFHPLVVCPGIGPLTEELAQRNVEVRFAPMPPWRKLFAYPKRPAAVRALRDVIAAVRPGLIHVNDIWWVPQALRAVAGVRIPIVAHVRQEIEPPKVRRYELDKVDLVLPMSRQIRQSLEKGGVLPERLKVLHSGVDLGAVPDHEDGLEIRRRFDIPADALVLGTVANLFARKGYDIMLRALPEIVATFPQVYYLIVGTGDAAYETRLRTMVRDLELERHVRFAGFQASVYPYLAAMDVYVHPALMEGFGIAVLEAMAMRKPVVATTAGGLSEVAQDGDTGILVPPGDPDALARAVLLLLQDPTRCRKLGEAGRDRVEALFTVDAMMDNLAAGYRALLGNAVRVQQAVSR